MQKNLKNKFLLTAAAISSLSMSSASAEVNYGSSAAISFIITIPSNTNPNDLSGLTLSETFQQLTDANNFFAGASGDGVYTVNNPILSPLPLIENSFAGTFAVSGSITAYGTVNTLHTGMFNLDFTNTSANNIQIDVTLTYLLNAVATEVYANTAIQLDYWDITNTLVGSDYVEAGTYPANSADNENQSGSAQLVLILAPSATDSLIAQIGISSHLDSTSAAPVPLPGTFWIFTGGLLGMISRKNKIRVT